MNKKQTQSLYSVSQVSKLMNITRKTLYYYDHAGLLAPAARLGSLETKYYGEAEIETLKKIKAYRAAGLKISEIQALFHKEKEPMEIFLQVRERLENQLTQRKEEIDNLNALMKEAEDKP